MIPMDIRPEKRLKVSVCIVAYNHGQYIEDCLSSVVGQRVDADLEILVGDDCSTDQTRQIISYYAEKHADLIYPVFHEKNFGGCHNYQYLINKASGDYIAHLDGDDYWLPGKLQSQINLLSQYPECVAVYSNAVVIKNSGEIFGAFNNRIPAQFDLDFLLAEGNFLNHSSMLYRSMFKSEILTISGPYLDYRTHLRFAQHGPLGHTNQVHVMYRIGSTTSAISNQIENVRRLYLEALMDLSAEVRKSPAMRSAMTQFYWGEVFQLARRGHFMVTFRLLRKIKGIAPNGTALHIVVKCLLHPLVGLWPKLRSKICSDSSPLKIYHPR